LDTHELIDNLVARHRPVEPGWIERSTTSVVIVGIGLAALVVGAALGFRPDLMGAFWSGRIVAKYIFMLTALVISGHLFLQMTRPGRYLADLRLCYALPLAFIAVAALIQVTLVGAPTEATVLGDQLNWLMCMIAVPVIGMIPFIGLIWILRRSAPTDLSGAGFAAGVFAATIAASVYAAHCPCDTPVFVLIWYPIAFTIGGLLGSWFAPRIARW
jgi:hypothetical protein